MCSLWQRVSAQQTLTLPQAIEMARLQSVDAAVALNELKTSYWEFRTYQADLLPEVNLQCFATIIARATICIRAKMVRINMCATTRCK